MIHPSSKIKKVAILGIGGLIVLILSIFILSRFDRISSYFGVFSMTEGTVDGYTNIWQDVKPLDSKEKYNFGMGYMFLPDHEWEYDVSEYSTVTLKTDNLEIFFFPPSLTGDTDQLIDPFSDAKLATSTLLPQIKDVFNTDRFENFGLKCLSNNNINDEKFVDFTTSFSGSVLILAEDRLGWISLLLMTEQEYTLHLGTLAAGVVGGLKRHECVLVVTEEIAAIIRPPKIVDNSAAIEIEIWDREYRYHQALMIWADDIEYCKRLTISVINSLKYESDKILSASELRQLVDSNN